LDSILEVEGIEIEDDFNEVSNDEIRLPKKSSFRKSRIASTLNICDLVDEEIKNPLPAYVSDQLAIVPKI